MDTRFINCEACGTEGRMLTNDGGPYDVDHGPCPVCNGERVVEIETAPVTDWEDVEQLTNVVPWCAACQTYHWHGQCDPDLDEQRF